MASTPIIALKAIESTQAKAERALTGDIYVRKWTSVKGKGKHRKVVEHEIHANPLTVLAAAAVGGVALAGGAIALWLTQQKVGKTTNPLKKIIRVREYGAEYKDVEVVDVPAVPAYTTIESVYHPEVWHTESSSRKDGFKCINDGSVVRFSFDEYGAITNEQFVEDWYGRHVTHGQIEPLYAMITVKVVDNAAYVAQEPLLHEAVPALTHMQHQLVKDAWSLVMNSYGIPYKRLNTVLYNYDQLFPTLRERERYTFVELKQIKTTDKYVENELIFEHKTRKQYGLETRKGWLE